MFIRQDSPHYHGPIITENLLAWWKQNEGLGNKVRDYGPEKKEGTIQGSLAQFWWATPVCGYYQASIPNYVNGIGRGLEIPGGGISLVAAVARGQDGVLTILSKVKYNGGSNCTGNYCLDYSSSNGGIRFCFASGGSFHIWQSTFLPTLWEWHIVTITYTFGVGSSIVLYDGVTQKSGSWSTGNGNAVPDAVNQYVHLGGFGNLDTDTSVLNLYHGFMGDVLLYNKVLSLDEIARNFNALKGRYGI